MLGQVENLGDGGGGGDVTNRNHHMSHGNQPPLSEGSIIIWGFQNKYPQIGGSWSMLKFRVYYPENAPLEKEKHLQKRYFSGVHPPCN